MKSFFEDVQHEENNAKNFTKQSEEVSSSVVLPWVVPRRPVDQRIGQQRKKCDVQNRLHAENEKHQEIETETSEHR